MVPLPLIYSCSGCSNVAQLANAVALDLADKKVAEMSCIAGVGGGVLPLVKKAQSGRTIIALDGCPLHCTQCCLQKVGVAPDIHLTLTEYDLSKRKYQPETQSQLFETEKTNIAGRITEALEERAIRASTSRN